MGENCPPDVAQAKAELKIIKEESFWCFARLCSSLSSLSHSSCMSPYFCPLHSTHRTEDKLPVPMNHRAVNPHCVFLKHIPAFRMKLRFPYRCFSCLVTGWCWQYLLRPLPALLCSVEVPELSKGKLLPPNAHRALPSPPSFCWASISPLPCRTPWEVVWKIGSSFLCSWDSLYMSRWVPL